MPRTEFYADVDVRCGVGDFFRFARSGIRDDFSRVCIFFNLNAYHHRWP